MSHLETTVLEDITETIFEPHVLQLTFTFSQSPGVLAVIGNAMRPFTLNATPIIVRPIALARASALYHK